MKRLTERHVNKSLGAYMVCSKTCDNHICSVDCKEISEIVDRLAAYEDTGLEPEEITDLQRAGDMYGGEEGLTALMDKANAAMPPNDPLTQRALDMVRAERERQCTFWGAQSGNSLFEWVSILGEEYGELCEAVNETSFSNAAHPDRGGFGAIIKEATQVAAVAVAIIEAAYRRKPEEGETCPKR